MSWQSQHIITTSSPGCETAFLRRCLVLDRPNTSDLMVISMDLFSLSWASLLSFQDKLTAHKIHFGVLCKPLFPSFISSFCSSENSMLLPCHAASMLSKKAYGTINRQLYWGDPCFLGETLHLQNSEVQKCCLYKTPYGAAPTKEYQGDSCILEKLCFRGTPRKEVLSLRDALRCSTHTSTKMTSSRILRPTRDFLQTHLQEPKFFFWLTSDAFWKRPLSSYQDSYMNFYKEIYE